jgi:hypothetical protein
MESKKLIFSATPGHLNVVFPDHPGLRAWFCSKLAIEAATLNLPVLCLSFDKSAHHCFTDLINVHSNVSRTAILNQAFNQEQKAAYAASKQVIEGLPIHIEDASKTLYSYEKLIEKVRLAIKDQGTKVIIIDSFEACGALLPDFKAPFWPHLEKLKNLASELGCSVYMKVNCEVTSEPPLYRPHSDMLVKAGLMDYWFDNIVAVYNPSFYGLRTWEDGSLINNHIEISFINTLTGSRSSTRNYLPRT